jgi:hypothetical protein
MKVFLIYFHLHFEKELERWAWTGNSGNSTVLILASAMFSNSVDILETI